MDLQGSPGRRPSTTGGLNRWPRELPAHRKLAVAPRATLPWPGGQLPDSAIRRAFVAGAARRAPPPTTPRAVAPRRRVSSLPAAHAPPSAPPPEPPPPPPLPP